MLVEHPHLKRTTVTHLVWSIRSVLHYILKKISLDELEHKPIDILGVEKLKRSTRMYTFDPLKHLAA